MPPCLTLGIIKYGSIIKWSSPGKRVPPSQNLDVVAIEKEAFGLPSTMVVNFTYLYGFKYLLLFNNNNLFAHRYIVSSMSIK